MANECNRIETRFDAFATESLRQREIRDDKIAGLEAVIADIDARLTAVQTAQQISAEGSKPPQWWQIMSAIGAGVGVLAIVGRSFLEPLHGEVQNLKEWRIEQRRDTRDLRKDQFHIRKELSELQGESHEP